MGGVADLAVRVSAEMDNFNKGMDDMDQKLKNLGGQMTRVGAGLTAGVTTPIVALGAVAFKTAADLQDAMGATEQIFGSAAKGMISWADELESYYGIAKGEALEYGNMMGSMLKNIGGLTEEESAKQAQTLIQLAGDLTAMYGGTTADAVRALTGALKGNNTMLDNYGMAANDAMVKTKAAEMGLVAEGEAMDLAAKQAATLALIMDQSGAAQGQAAREADGASGSMRALMTELKNLSAQFGDVLLPLITPLIASLSDLLEKFSKMSPTTQKIIVVIAGLAAALGPVLIIVGQVITAISAIAPVVATVGGVIGGVAAGPILLIVAAIAAVIAIIVLCVKYWDEIMAALKAGWEWLSGVFQKWWEDFSTFWSNLWENIKSTLADATAFISDLWVEVQIIFVTAMIKLRDGLIEKFDAIVEFFTGVKDKIVGIFTGIKDLVLGIWDGIVSGIKGFINLIIGAVNGMIGGMNKLKWDAPDWVPLLGGKSWGVNIPKIPLLDTGGLVKGPGVFQVGSGVTEVVRRYDPSDNAARSGSSRLEVFGKIQVEGTDSKGQLVGVVDILYDRILDRLLEEARA